MTSVSDLFEFAETTHAGCVPWGTAVPLTGPGVYVVAATADASEAAGFASAPLDQLAIAELLKRHPGATVDGRMTDARGLAQRLNLMWPQGEPAAYIGLAGRSVQARVRQFYATQIGARAPHAGGWPVKMLESRRLWVHFGASELPSGAEVAMVDHFVDRVPVAARRALIDPTAPLPFANLKFPTGRKKRHGLGGVKTARPVPQLHVSPASSSTQSSRAGDAALVPTPLLRSGTRQLTQNVTEVDLERGQLRIPRAVKSILPAEVTRIRIVLGGEAATVSWDPRTEGARERSGVIRVGRALLARHARVGGPRKIDLAPDGTVLIS